jgi:hypothetical protein
MYGTASAIGALYTGEGDIAILGQVIYPFEVKAFEQARDMRRRKLRLQRAAWMYGTSISPWDHL